MSRSALCPPWSERQTRELLKLAAKNVGWRKATHALTYAMQWGLVAHDLGHDPSVDEYADWWHMPRTTAFRHQREFRAAFPPSEHGGDTPRWLLDLAS